MTNITKRLVKVQVEVRQTVQGEGAEKTVTHSLREFDGLNVRFDILKRRGSLQNKATVAICNLKRETVEYLTSINEWNTPAAYQKIIRVFAGYEGKYGLIFEGDIINAMPSMPPDVWLTAQCLSGYHNNMRVGSISFTEKMKAKEIAARVARELNLGLLWQADENKTVSGFAFNGGLTNAIKELNDIGGITAYQEDNFLVVANAKMKKPKEGTVARLYSKHSGLIGLPEVQQYGVNFKVLLDPTIKCGEPVQLQSEQIPAGNGVYYIYSVRHRGELRADTYYTEIEAKSYDW